MFIDIVWSTFTWISECKEKHEKGSAIWVGSRVTDCSLAVVCIHGVIHVVFASLNKGRVVLIDIQFIDTVKLFRSKQNIDFWKEGLGVVDTFLTGLSNTSLRLTWTRIVIPWLIFEGFFSLPARVVVSTMGPQCGGRATGRPAHVSSFRGFLVFWVTFPVVLQVTSSGPTVCQWEACSTGD